MAEFSGTDRAIGEYLMAEMLERQPSEVQSMLMRTSLVDRVNGELADLLAGRSGSEQMLLELEDANAFVVSLDRSARGFATTTFWRISCASSSADDLPTRFPTSTAGPPSGSLTTGRWSRRCGTRSRPATGRTRRGCSRTTCSV